jgi:predicted RNase H-like nuclease (RuvC/YqgF family)
MDAKELEYEVEKLRGEIKEKDREIEKLTGLLDEALAQLETSGNDCMSTYRDLGKRSGK